MREILKKIEETQAEYHAAIDEQPARVTQEIAGRLKKLREELAATIVEGAGPCLVKFLGVDYEAIQDSDFIVFQGGSPKGVNREGKSVVLRKGCGQVPHGIQQPTGFEIGCANCGDARNREDRPKGILPSIAVDAWNEQQAHFAELLAKGR